jgi:hypothetical protein
MGVMGVTCFYEIQHKRALGGNINVSPNSK